MCGLGWIRIGFEVWAAEELSGEERQVDSGWSLRDAMCLDVSGNHVFPSLVVAQGADGAESRAKARMEMMEEAWLEVQGPGAIPCRLLDCNIMASEQQAVSARAWPRSRGVVGVLGRVGASEDRLFAERRVFSSFLLLLKV